LGACKPERIKPRNMPPKGLVTGNWLSIMATTSPSAQYSPIFFHPYDHTAGGRAKNTARIAFRLAGIGLGRPRPIHAPKRMASAGFDHSVAIAPRCETRSKSDVKRGGGRERRRRTFQQSRIDHDSELDHPEQIRIRVDDHGDAIRFLPRGQLIRFDQPRLYAFDRVRPLVHRFGKGNCSAHRQRLRKFSDGDMDARPMQAQCHACGKVAAASN
jgi:hypothetical protein